MDEMTRVYVARVRRLATIFAEAQGLALSTVGRLVAGRGDFFEKLDQGRVTLRRIKGAIQSLSNMWPDGTPWPDDLPRPAPSPPGPEEAAA